MVEIGGVDGLTTPPNVGYLEFRQLYLRQRTQVDRGQCGERLAGSYIGNRELHPNCLRVRARLSCHGFRNNEVRLQLHALPYNMGNFLRTLALRVEPS